jgi:hypothetical protein
VLDHGYMAGRPAGRPWSWWRAAKWLRLRFAPPGGVSVTWQSTVEIAVENKSSPRHTTPAVPAIFIFSIQQQQPQSQLQSQP